MGAYRTPAFYFKHGFRDSLSTPTTAPVEASQDVSRLFDGRQGSVFAFSVDWVAQADFRFQYEMDLSAAGQAIDTIILSGHNFPDAKIEVLASPSLDDLLEPNYTVVEPIGEPIVVTLSESTFDTHLVVVLVPFNVDTSIKPECSELFATTKHELVRGAEPDFNTSWRTSQIRLENSSGVSSTLLRGAARKTYTMTWDQLVGADRQVMLDLREQTDDFSQPWWFLPPDVDFGIVLVELDRDPNFVQAFDNPLETGTSDRVTLNMIEVTG